MMPALDTLNSKGDALEAGGSLCSLQKNATNAVRLERLETASNIRASSSIDKPRSCSSVSRDRSLEPNRGQAARVLANDMELRKGLEAYA